MVVVARLGARQRDERFAEAAREFVQTRHGAVRKVGCRPARRCRLGKGITTRHRGSARLRWIPQLGLCRGVVARPAEARD